MTPISADGLLVRVLGSTLEVATVRLVAGSLVLAVVGGLLIWIV